MLRSGKALSCLEVSIATLQQDQSPETLQVSLIRRAQTLPSSHHVIHRRVQALVLRRPVRLQHLHVRALPAARRALAHGGHRARVRPEVHEGVLRVRPQRGGVAVAVGV